MDDPEAAPRFALEAMGYGVSPAKATAMDALVTQHTREAIQRTW